MTVSTVYNSLSNGKFSFYTSPLKEACKKCKMKSYLCFFIAVLQQLAV